MGWLTAAERADRLLGKLNVKELQSADEDGTGWADPLLATDWRVPWTCDAVARAWVRAVQPTTSHLVLASLHADGRVRQAAVERMASAGPDLLPAVLVRAADWVPQVAELARRVFHELCDLAAEHELERVFVVAFRMRTWDRLPLDLLEIAGKRLSHFPAAIERLRHRETMEFLEACGVHLPGETLSDRLLIADRRYHAVNFVVAEMAAQSELPLDIGRALLASRFPSVRASILDRCPFEPHEMEPLLMDPSARVRLGARWNLSRLAQWDFAAYYRERLPDPAAVRGYAEVEAPNAVGQLEPLLRHPKGKVRRAALQAIGHRLPVGDLVEMMDDRSRRVAVEAGRALIKSGQRPRLRELLPLAAQGPLVGGGAAARKSAKCLATWDRLEFWLSFSMLERTTLYASSLESWLRARARVPRPDSFQRERIEWIHERCHGLLHEVLWEGIAGELRYWRNREGNER